MNSSLFQGADYLSKAILWGLIAYTLFYIVFRRTAKKSFDLIQYIFTVYIVCLAYITGILPFSNWSLHSAHTLNLTFLTAERNSYIILNLVVFLPLGFLLRAIFKKLNKKHIIGICFLASVFIETIQYLFVGRLADIDDVAANTLGGILGLLIFELLHKLFPVKTNKQCGFGTGCLILSLLVVFFGTTFSQFLCFGDMILARWKVPIWQGITGDGAIALSGIHYSLFLYLLMEVLSTIIVWKHPDDLWCKKGRYLALATCLYFVVKIILNLIFQM